MKIRDKINSLTIKNDEGYTFLIVIWTIVILSFIFVNLVDEVFLDRHLLEYEMRELNLRQAEISALKMAINTLKQDEIIDYDAFDNIWANEIETEINSIKCKIVIKDYGSKLNINYIDTGLLEEELWWEEEIENRLAEGMIPDLVLLRDILLDEDYAFFIETFTTLGKFNINGDSLDSLENFLSFYGISEGQINTIKNSVESHRERGTYFQNGDELLANIDGLNHTILEEIEDNLSFEGRININMVSEEVLETLIMILGLSENTLNNLIAYRNVEPIDELESLRNIINEDDYELLKPYLTSRSIYFQVSIQLKDESDEHLRSVKVDLKRTYLDNDNFKIKIIRFHE
ncbi:hypothetical protein [Natronospora cellulosivora (SeqCode)]